MTWPFSSCTRSLKAAASAGIRAQWTSCTRQVGPTRRVSTLPSAAQLDGQEQVMKTSVVTANTKEIKGTEPLQLFTVQLEEHPILSLEHL